MGVSFKAKNLLSSGRFFHSRVDPFWKGSLSREANSKLQKLKKRCFFGVSIHVHVNMVFLNYETEFIILLAVLENSVMPMG